MAVLCWTEVLALLARIEIVPTCNAISNAVLFDSSDDLSEFISVRCTVTRSIRLPKLFDSSLDNIYLIYMQLRSMLLMMRLIEVFMSSE